MIHPYIDNKKDGALIDKIQTIGINLFRKQLQWNQPFQMSIEKEELFYIVVGKELNIDYLKRFSITS